MRNRKADRVGKTKNEKNEKFFTFNRICDTYNEWPS